MSGSVGGVAAMLVAVALQACGGASAPFGGTWTSLDGGVEHITCPGQRVLTVGLSGSFTFSQQGELITNTGGGAGCMLTFTANGSSATLSSDPEDCSEVGDAGATETVYTSLGLTLTGSLLSVTGMGSSQGCVVSFSGTFSRD